MASRLKEQSEASVLSEHYEGPYFGVPGRQRGTVDAQDDDQVNMGTEGSEQGLGNAHSDSDTGATDSSGWTSSDEQVELETQVTPEGPDHSMTLCDLAVAQIETESDLLSSTPFAPVHPAYTTLDEHQIRLLRILPTKTDGMISIEIQPTRPDNRSEYTAISYAWGSQCSIWEIMVNGRKLLVPTNLMRFLEHARKLGAILASWLWIDMLCINQRDLEERANQVSRMSGIFGGATKVVVWLGPAHSNSDAAMSALAKPNNDSRASIRFQKVWAGASVLGMDHLCRRPYWRRLWVFQELRMAQERQLMCGNAIVPWERFEAFLRLVENVSEMKRFTDGTEVIRASPAMKMFKIITAPPDATLWPLIQSTRHLRCVDLRDRAYALLGVIAKASEDRSEITPDYNKPIPAFLNLVLKELYRLHPPLDLKKAQERCQLVERVLGVRPDTIYMLESNLAPYTNVNTIDLSTCRLGPPDHKISLWWAHFYGHSAVTNLLIRSWSYNHWESDDPLYPHGTVTNGTVTRSKIAQILIDSWLTVSAIPPGNIRPEDKAPNVFDILIRPKQYLKESQMHLVQDFGWSSLQHTIADTLFIAMLQGDVGVAQLFLAPGGYLASLDICLSTSIMGLVRRFKSCVSQRSCGLKDEPDSFIAGVLSEVRTLNLRKRMPLLFFSVLTGDSDCVQKILNSGRCENNQTWDSKVRSGPRVSMSALHLAAHLGETRILRTLLDAEHADVNACSGAGSSVLMHAVLGSSSDCVRLILERKECDVNWRKNTGSTALHLAAYEEPESLRLLLDDKRVQINMRDKYGCSALMNAAESSSLKCIKILLEHEDCDVDMQNNNGKTALYLAATHDKPEIIRHLLNPGYANPNLCSSTGFSTLMIAADLGLPDCVEVLLRARACDVDMTNSKGQTALCLAIGSLPPTKRLLRVVRLLLQIGHADTSIVDDSGQNAMDHLNQWSDYCFENSLYTEIEHELLEAVERRPPSPAEQAIEGTQLQNRTEKPEF